MPAPVFFDGIIPKNAGSFAFSPVHVTDVAKCFVQALEKDSTIRKTYEVGGPNTVTWKELIKTIASAYGKKKWSLPAPVLPVKIMASIFGRYSWFPITADQLTMLMEGNTCSSNVLNEFNIESIPFNSANLSYLKK